MKLGDLRAAIRKTKGAPTISIPVPGHGTITLNLMKTPLLEALERFCPGGKAAETPFEFDTETAELRMIVEAAGVVERLTLTPTGIVTEIVPRHVPQADKPRSLLDDAPAAPAPSVTSLLV